MNLEMSTTAIERKPTDSGMRNDSRCFSQSAQKFKTRYATLAFSDTANLDDAHTWPIAFALMALTAAEQAKIGALVKNAVSED
jgi:hypothetical protein